MLYDAAATARLVRETDADPSDQRSDFGRDRDRVLYSTAFARLAGKTQVVGSEELGQFHTRLTHTLQVAQLGRRLAERLRAQYAKQIMASPIDGLVPPDPDLVEAACLAHDLGHPPFGHIGESVLNDVFDSIARSRVHHWQRSGVTRFGGFEGNAQTFRILTYLSARTPVDPRCGLNLTRATLDACSKYPWLRKAGGRKWGAYGLDAERLTWVRHDAGVGYQSRQSFEAQLMDWCDDVTYAVHDVIDFYRSGHIPLHRLLAVEGSSGPGGISAEADLFIEDVLPRYEPDLPQALAKQAWLELALCADFDGPWESSAKVKALCQSATSTLITHLTNAITWRGQAPMTHYGDLVIDNDSDSATRKLAAVDVLKAVLRHYVISRPALGTQQHGARTIVRTLLEAYADRPKDLLPTDRLEELKEHGDPLRAATDHVATLTEPGAVALYRRMVGVRIGLISDTL